MTDAPATPTALLLVTGDELLRGFVAEANAVTIARDLRHVGIDLVSVRVVGDDADALRDAVSGALDAGVDLVVVTGGLGPTHDDRTTEVVAACAGLQLELREDALEVVEARLRAFGRMRTPDDAATFAPGNRKQATFPIGASWVSPGGTAPGYIVRAREVVVVVLPGPPAELRHAWRQLRTTPEFTEVVARAPERIERLVRAWGVPESAASQLLRELSHEDDADVRVTLCARDGEIELSVRGRDAHRVNELVEGLVIGLGEAVFAVDDERSVAELVGAALKLRGEQLAVAESCTGGLLGAAVTAVSGASEWFLGGVVSYANDAKEQLLGVPHDTIEDVGAVSPETAIAMAEGAVRALGADVAVSVTGIAGPGGGTPDKPVGTVHVGVARANGEPPVVRRLQLGGDRTTIRRRSVAAALHLLREVLDGGA